MLLVSELKNTSVRKGNILSIYHPFLNTIIIRPPVPHEEQEYHDADNAGLPVIGFPNPESVALPLEVLRQVDLGEPHCHGVEHQHVGLIGVRPVDGSIHQRAGVKPVLVVTSSPCEGVSPGEDLPLPDV